MPTHVVSAITIIIIICFTYHQCSKRTRQPNPRQAAASQKTLPTLSMKRERLLTGPRIPPVLPAGQSQVADSSNSIEAPLKSIKSSVFPRFNIPAPAKQTPHPAKTNTRGSARGEGGSCWRQPSSLNFLRSRYKHAFIKKGAASSKNTDSAQKTLLPFTLSVSLRCVQFNDGAKPASPLPATRSLNPKTKPFWSRAQHCLIYWKKNKSREGCFAHSTFPFACLHQNSAMEGGNATWDPYFVKNQPILHVSSSKISQKVLQL